MALIWRLTGTELKQHWKALLFVILVAASASATPYAFAMLGRWLVDEVLLVAPAAPSEENEGSPDAGDPPDIRVPGADDPADIPPEPNADGAASEFTRARMNNAMVFSLRTSLHRKLASMDLATFSREQVGQLMTRVLDDVSGIPGNLTQFFVNAVTQSGMLVLGLVLLLRLNPAMTLIVLGVLPFYAVTCYIFLPRIRRNTVELRDRVAELNGFVVERLSNIVTIKNYAQEARETVDFGGRIDHNIGLSQRQHRLNLFFNTLTTLITGLGTLSVLALGFLNLRAGRMQLGEVLAFHAVTAQLFVPISALVGLGAVSQSIYVLADRVFGILDSPDVIVDPENPVDPDSVRGDVAFENVSLRYSEGGPFAVDNVNLHIPSGNTVALVGPTGSGKSTLLMLLTRLFDPTEGVVRLDGLDVRRLRVARLRTLIGNVMGRCTVFTGTVAENIAYGRPDAPREEIEEAARAVGLHDFVISLAEDYETRLGRGGIALNDEQLAMLGFARALLTGPAVLTIDDTFSGLDESVERPLRRAVREAHGRRTVLMATSRLSLCRDVDLVVMLRNGRIEETGTFEELMSRPGSFHRMYCRQMGEPDLHKPEPPEDKASDSDE